MTEGAGLRRKPPITPQVSGFIRAAPSYRSYIATRRSAAKQALAAERTAAIEQAEKDEAVRRASSKRKQKDAQAKSLSKTQTSSCPAGKSVLSRSKLPPMPGTRGASAAPKSDDAAQSRKTAALKTAEDKLYDTATTWSGDYPSTESQDRYNYRLHPGPPGLGLKSSSHNLVCSRQFLQSPLPTKEQYDTYEESLLNYTNPKARTMPQPHNDYSDPLPAVNLAPMRFTCLKGVPGRMTPRGKINRTNQTLFKEDNVPYDNLRGKGIPFRTLEYVPDYLNTQLINWKKSTVNPEKYSKIDSRCLKYKTMCALEMEKVEREVSEMNHQEVTEALHKLAFAPKINRIGAYPCRMQDDNQSQIPLRMMDDPTIKTDKTARPYLNHFATYTTVT
uniref:Uncharacterized protein n=1 Tax=Pyramimonas obovata TaxID=1411642 RepID=A0A7S0RJF3_9CHLO|mmetsp:Transcript_35776/g.78097  ORF Transcript_35776/g.78097 Transcript_35776/m.78097 type:complete len:389 (+) Transcript_35776:307-1473(+)